jgi:hypothetical protein
MVKTPATDTGRSKAEERSKSGSLLFRSWLWLKAQIFQEVPKEIELCEFDCRKEQCALGEWETCDRRLHRAEGELMPRSVGRVPKT